MIPREQKDIFRFCRKKVLSRGVSMGYLVSEQEVQFYDEAVPDWPGELDFYRAMAIEVRKNGGSILELGCGTGRVALQLIQEGVPLVGLDLSPAMLTIARQKSQGVANVRWVESDMQTFDLGVSFDLILIPGHSFQFMLTPSGQIASLTCIRRHLTPGGKLVIHVNHDDFSWLGRLVQGEGTGFRWKGEYRQNSTKETVRKWTAWSYEARTQTASATDAWEFIGEDGAVKERRESVAKPLHCFFPLEMEHLLSRTGFEVEALYGDFFRHELQNTSPDMIWVARAGQQ
jgi:SAM-dependent methyltransferase